MLGLVKYDAACKALAEAKAVDEAKEIRDVAMAMRIYAKQAKNRKLEVQAGDIRIRAERRIGQLMKAQKETVGLAKGGQPHQRKNSTGVSKTPVEPTLNDAGIDKNLAKRARKLAAVPEDEFEAELSGLRERVSKETKRVTTKLAARGKRELANVGEEAGAEAAFLIRAEAAAEFAFYSGPITKDVVRLARRANAAWHALAEALDNQFKETA